MKKIVKIVVFTLIFLGLFIFSERFFSVKEEVSEKSGDLSPIKKVWKEYQKNRSFKPENYSKEDFLKIIEEKKLSDGVKYPFDLPQWYKIRLDELNEGTEIEIAEKVFDFIADTGENSLGIEFSDSINVRPEGNKFPEDLLACDIQDRKAKCDEIAFLYTASCRYLGLDSFIVQVDIDTFGVFTAHACSSVISDDGRMILVDPAYRLFDVFHQLYIPLDDIEATALLFAGSHKIFFGLGKNDNARTAIEIAKELYIKNDYVLNGIILQSFYDGEIDNALKYSLDMINMKGISPYNKYYGYMAAGMSYIFKKDFKQAEKMFSENISLLSELRKLAKIEKAEALEKIITSHLFYAGILQVNNKPEAEKMLEGFHTNYDIPEEMIIQVEGAFKEAGVSVEL